MQYLVSLFNFVFSRAMLAFLGLAVLGLAIWFVGPLIAVDGLRPLASVGVRIGLLVLLLVFAILWLASVPVGPAGVVALCLLIWHAGPLLLLGTARPLESVWARAGLMAVLVLICAVYWLARLWQAVKADPHAITKFFAAKSEDDRLRKDTREQLRSVTASVRAAVAQLRTLRGDAGLHRVFEGKRHLYDLPWYLVLGSPDAGKTTALLNAGLQFPLARKMGGRIGNASPASVAGTLHCDWWLSNEAVLIDTAGRYTTHDSDAANDAIEWHGFLGLLRKHRTRPHGFERPGRA
jgi:type VI secretion system protein ImpL